MDLGEAHSWKSRRMEVGEAQAWDFGPLQVQSSDVDFKAKMKEFNPHCSDLALDYSITIGTFVRTKVLAPLLPWSADYDSGWLPLAGSDRAMETLASVGLLPKASCKVGPCSGQLPSCAPGALPDMHVPHLQFELSRTFHWTDKSLQGVRHVLAFGLAILPEALDIIVARKDSSSKEAHRRLGSSLAVTHQFAVRFSQPLNYQRDTQ